MPSSRRPPRIVYTGALILQPVDLGDMILVDLVIRAVAEAPYGVEC